MKQDPMRSTSVPEMLERLDGLPIEIPASRIEAYVALLLGNTHTEFTESDSPAEIADRLVEIATGCGLAIAEIERRQQRLTNTVIGAGLFATVIAGWIVGPLMCWAGRGPLDSGLTMDREAGLPGTWTYTVRPMPVGDGLTEGQLCALNTALQFLMGHPGAAGGNRNTAHLVQAFAKLKAHGYTIHVDEPFNCMGGTFRAVKKEEK